MENNQYNKPKIEDLESKYRNLCFELGMEKEADNIPSTREDLIKEIKELNFKWIHDNFM